MSKHNYSQYSNYKKQNTEVEAKTVKEYERPVIEPVEETVVEPVSAPKTVKGVVFDCKKLNVRIKPSITAAVVCILDAKTEVEVNPEKSTDEWLHVCVANGAEGYCMRQYIKTRL